MEVGGEQAETVLSSVDGFGSGRVDTRLTAPDCRYEQFCRALGLLPLPERPRIIGREIWTALNKSDGRPQSMGLSPSCGLPAFTNMVLSLKEGPGSNVTNGCCWVSKEDVCGDDHVRVVSAISISIYYPYLLSVRVDGSGVNPRAPICFNASAKTRSPGRSG